MEGNSSEKEEKRGVRGEGLLPTLERIQKEAKKYEEISQWLGKIKPSRQSFMVNVLRSVR